jgi:hypothetical protein
VSEYKVYPWELNIGVNAYWLGGPSVDGDGAASGGFAFADMSSFVKPDRPGFQQKAWLISGILGPTTAQGRCLQFQYNIDGLNVEALRLELWKPIADTFL